MSGLKAGPTVLWLAGDIKQERSLFQSDGPLMSDKTCLMNGHPVVVGLIHGRGQRQVSPLAALGRDDKVVVGT